MHVADSGTFLSPPGSKLEQWITFDLNEIIVLSMTDKAVVARECGFKHNPRGSAASVQPVRPPPNFTCPDFSGEKKASDEI